MTFFFPIHPYALYLFGSSWRAFQDLRRLCAGRHRGLVLLSTFKEGQGEGDAEGWIMEHAIRWLAQGLND